VGAAGFLLSPGMQKVLGLVFAEPERSYTLNELLDRAAGGRGNSQRQIEKLLAAGVLDEGPRRARQRCRVRASPVDGSRDSPTPS